MSGYTSLFEIVLKKGAISKCSQFLIEALANATDTPIVDSAAGMG